LQAPVPAAITSKRLDGIQYPPDHRLLAHRPRRLPRMCQPVLGIVKRFGWCPQLSPAGCEF